MLSRKKNETIHIGNGIKITVVEIHSGKVRLGFEADKSIPILRGEIMERIQDAEPVSVCQPSKEPELRGAL